MTETAVVATGVLLIAATIALGIISGLTNRQNQALLAANSEIKANFERAEAENKRAEQNLAEWRQSAFDLRLIARRCDGTNNRSGGPAAAHDGSTRAHACQNVRSATGRPRGAKRLAQACRIHANVLRLTKGPGWKSASDLLPAVISTSGRISRHRPQRQKIPRSTRGNAARSIELARCYRRLERCPHHVATLGDRGGSAPPGTGKAQTTPIRTRPSCSIAAIRSWI